LISLPLKIEREIGIPEGTAKRILADLRHEAEEKDVEPRKQLEKKLRKLEGFILDNGIDFKKEAIRMIKKFLDEIEKK
jgi:hypothetical protein